MRAGRHAQASGEPEPLVMARLLQIDGANPKNLIGVLMNDHNVVLVRAGLDRASLQKIDTAIATFAANSKNGWVNGISAEARASLTRGPIVLPTK